MGKYIVKRLLLIIPVILCVAVLIFSILYFVPGDPVEIKYGTSLTIEQKEAYRTEMGLNDPFFVQLHHLCWTKAVTFGTGWPGVILSPGKISLWKNR